MLQQVYRMVGKLGILCVLFLGVPLPVSADEKVQAKPGDKIKVTYGGKEDSVAVAGDTGIEIHAVTPNVAYPRCRYSLELVVTGKEFPADLRATDITFVRPFFAPGVTVEKLLSQSATRLQLQVVIEQDVRYGWLDLTIREATATRVFNLDEGQTLDDAEDWLAHIARNRDRMKDIDAEIDHDQKELDFYEGVEKDSWEYWEGLTERRMREEWRGKPETMLKGASWIEFLRKRTPGAAAQLVFEKAVLEFLKRVDAPDFTPEEVNAFLLEVILPEKKRIRGKIRELAAEQRQLRDEIPPLRERLRVRRGLLRVCAERCDDEYKAQLTKIEERQEQGRQKALADYERAHNAPWEAREEFVAALRAEHERWAKERALLNDTLSRAAQQAHAAMMRLNTSDFPTQEAFQEALEREQEPQRQAQRALEVGFRTHAANLLAIEASFKERMPRGPDHDRLAAALRAYDEAIKTVNALYQQENAQAIRTHDTCMRHIPPER